MTAGLEYEEIEVDELVSTLDLFKINNDLTMIMTLFDINEMTEKQGVYSLDEDKRIIVRVDTNAQFKADNRTIALQMRHKEFLVYETMLKFLKSGKQTLYFEFPLQRFYDRFENGGVIMIKLTEIYFINDITKVKDLINMERLVYLKPKNVVKFRMQVDQETGRYIPGETVSMNVRIAPQDVEFGQKYYVSVTVTDLSSYIEIPKVKHQPSLPTMIHLEKEVKHMSGRINEFTYSSEYIEHYFETEPHANLKTKDELALLDKNTDLLLGVQNWRKGFFDDIRVIQDKMTKMEFPELEQNQYCLGFI